jgi:glycerophosphoryl diester phosphodiesterase
VSVWASHAPFVVGHRGGRGEGWPPENTLEAFDRARRQGAAAIELDTRASADGEAVVFHDPALTRMTSRRDLRQVSDVSLGALREVDVGAGARIPKLADVLRWARACGAGVNVELKYDVPRRSAVVHAAARALRESGADVLLSSFDPAMLAMAAAMVPSVPRALLTHAGQPRWAWVLQRMLGPPLVSAVHLERTQVGSGPVALARSRVRVGVWTVNSPPEAADLVRRGAAWIISDAPGEVLAAIRGYSHVTGSSVVPGG